MSCYPTISIKIATVEKCFIGYLVFWYALFFRGLRDTAGDGLFLISSFHLFAFEVLTALLVLRYQREILPIMRQNKLFLLLIMIPIISSVWSLSPVHTFIFSYHLFMTAMLALYMRVRFTNREIIRYILLGLIVVIILSLIMVLFRPGAGIHGGLHSGKWRGIYFHKNFMSREMAVAIILFIAAIGFKSVHKGISIMGVLLAGLLIFQSGGTAAIGALAASLLTYLVLSTMRFQFSVRIMLSLSSAIAIVALTIILSLNYELALSSIGKDITLTNRAGIWIYSIQSIFEKPMLGYGYNAFWLNQSRVLQDINWMSPHAHNAYLEMALDIGYIGLGLFIFILGRTVKRLISQLYRGRTEYAWMLSILVFLLIANLTDPGIMWPNHLDWLLISIIIVSAPSERQRNQIVPLNEELRHAG